MQNKLFYFLILLLLIILSTIFGNEGFREMVEKERFQYNIAKKDYYTEVPEIPFNYRYTDTNPLLYGPNNYVPTATDMAKLRWGQKGILSFIYP